MSKFTTKSTGLLTSVDYKNISMRWFYWFLFLIALIIAAVCLFPPVWLAISCLKSLQEMYSMTPTFFPKAPQWGKIIDVWNQLKFGLFYLNSTKIVIGSIIFAVGFNSLMGFVLSQMKPKGTSLLMILMLWTLLLPNTVCIVPVYLNIVNFPFIHLNFTNTPWPMWFMAGSNAFYVMIFKSFFDDIPRSYTEAAMLDGCSPFNIFSKIFLPISKPVVFVIVIFTIIAEWSNFFWPYLVLTNENQYTVMIRIFSLIGSGATGKGLSIDYQMLAILYSLIPPVIIFFLLQKYILRGGLSLGGIKE